MKNRKTEPVTIEILSDFPRSGENLEVNIPYVEKPGNIMSWNITLNSGEGKSIVYKYLVR